MSNTAINPSPDKPMGSRRSTFNASRLPSRGAVSRQAVALIGCDTAERTRHALTAGERSYGSTMATVMRGVADDVTEKITGRRTLGPGRTTGRIDRRAAWVSSRARSPLTAARAVLW